VRNKFLVNFWNCTILLCIPCIISFFSDNHVIRKVNTIYKTNVSEKMVHFTTVWRKAKCHKSGEWLYIVPYYSMHKNADGTFVSHL
jgi:hypothetical protein